MHNKTFWTIMYRVRWDPMLMDQNEFAQSPKASFKKSHIANNFSGFPNEALEQALMNPITIPPDARCLLLVEFLEFQLTQAHPGTRWIG